MTAILSYALCTLADVKETLGIASGNTSKDNLITRKINQATEMIEGYCGLDKDHHFKQANYTNEEYKGTGTSDLFLKALPVTAVSDFSVRTGIENTSNFNTIDTENYFIQANSGVIRTLTTLMDFSNSYRVSYTAGFATIPSDLSEACVTLAAYLTDNNASGSAVSKKQEGRRSIEYFQPQQGQSLINQLGIDDLLDRYVLPSLAGW